jgi:hypothetical protein
LDTIVGVSVTHEGETIFHEDVLAKPLQYTAWYIQQAMKVATEKGKSEIDLELNRLIKGFYGDE